jgi:RNA polymerase sigma-70 factor (ECF subfamily)
MPTYPSKAFSAARDAEQLIAAIARDRDPAAFADLFQIYAPKLKGYLVRRRVPDAIAEELAQDALLTVWRKADRFDSEYGNASTWIFTIVRNILVDDFRHRRCSEDRHMPAGGQDPATPEQHLDAAQGVECVRQAIDALPANQASVLRMAFFEDRTHSEIAATLNLPVGTVKGRIRLAASKLRTLLGDYHST